MLAHLCSLCKIAFVRGPQKLPSPLLSEAFSKNVTFFVTIYCDAPSLTILWPLSAYINFSSSFSCSLSFLLVVSCICNFFLYTIVSFSVLWSTWKFICLRKIKSFRRMNTPLQSAFYWLAVDLRYRYRCAFLVNFLCLYWEFCRTFWTVSLW